MMMVNEDVLSAFFFLVWVLNMGLSPSFDHSSCRRWRVAIIVRELLGEQHAAWLLGIAFGWEYLGLWVLGKATAYAACYA